MGTEDWVFKGTKLITTTKKAKIKNLEQRFDFQKYNLKEKKKKKKSQKLFFKIYEVCFKNRVFFWEKQQQVIKMKIKGVIVDLKILKS